jgi:hypothetical protein
MNRWQIAARLASYAIQCGAGFALATLIVICLSRPA